METLVYYGALHLTCSNYNCFVIDNSNICALFSVSCLPDDETFVSKCIVIADHTSYGLLSHRTMILP